MKHCLLDSSFLIDLLNEIAGGNEGAALAWLRRNGSGGLWISPVTLAEVLEGADDPDAVKDCLRRYSWQRIHRVHADLVATSQRPASHRLGENDAWQAAIAEQMGAVLIGHDTKAFKRLGAAYEDHWRE
jgi:predicted nucleic acid-binding protein